MIGHKTVILSETYTSIGLYVVILLSYKQYNNNINVYKCF